MNRDGSCEKCPENTKVSDNQQECEKNQNCKTSRELKEFPGKSKCTID